MKVANYTDNEGGQLIMMVANYMYNDGRQLPYCPVYKPRLSGANIPYRDNEMG